MKAFKKLSVCLAMLVLSMSMLGTSTFAWFSMNTQVSATGMKVKVQAASTLLVHTTNALDANGKLNNGVASITALNTDCPETGIRPTSTTNGTDWFYAVATQAHSYLYKEGTCEQITSEAQLVNYRLANTFYIQAYDATSKKSTTSSGTVGTYDPANKKLVVKSIEVQYTTGDKLSSTFRVMVVMNENVVVCGPTKTGAPTNNGIVAVESGAITSTASLEFANVSTLAGGVATLSSNNTLLETMNFNEVYQADIYVYFDGEDPECNTDNIPQTLDNYTVIVTFETLDL